MAESIDGEIYRISLKRSSLKMLLSTAENGYEVWGESTVADASCDRPFHNANKMRIGQDSTIRDGVKYYIIVCPEKHASIIRVLLTISWLVHSMIYYCFVTMKTGLFIFLVCHIESLKPDLFVMPGF